MRFHGCAASLPLVCCLLGAAAGRVTAQTTTGRISGTVTDSEGAVIPAAGVVVRNPGTQDTRNVVTDAQGFYVANDLPVGLYTVEVNQPGFKSESHSGFNLEADGHLTVDFRLQIGSVSQTVDVVAAQTEMLNTVSGELSRVIDQTQVDNLALNGGNYEELMTLVPGVIVTNPDSFSVTTSLSATNQVVNGHRSNSNNLTIDGAFNMDGGSNGSLINNVNSNFIQEVKIQTSNFSAEYGRMSGAAFNIVTKNGTNQFHGGAFEYLRNDALDARNFFAPNNTELRFNNFGYDVGGPVFRNKVFFFVGEQWKILRQQQAPSRTTLPTNAELDGNFNGVKTLDFPGTKTPIPGDIIPASMITADGRAIANLYRYGHSQAVVFTDKQISNNTTYEGSNPLDYREDLARLDYRINDRHTIYARYIEDYNQIYLPSGTGSSTEVPVTPEIRNRPGKSVLLAETWLPAPTVINEIRAGAAWNGQHYFPQGASWLRDTYGFQFPTLYSGGEYHNGIPDVAVSGYASAKGPGGVQISPTTDIQFADNLTIVRGPHTIRAGFVIIRNRKDQNGQTAYTGNVNFNQSGNSNTSANSLADALLGNVRTYSEASYDPIGHFRFTEPEAFVEDSWHVNRKLSLEFGIRWEYFQPTYTQANNLANCAPGLFDFTNEVHLTPQGAI
ncbi:MAG: TonB-dependent receptor, partial [Bryobacteraceae bacterium]